MQEKTNIFGVKIYGDAKPKDKRLKELFGEYDVIEKRKVFTLEDLEFMNHVRTRNDIYKIVFKGPVCVGMSLTTMYESHFKMEDVIDVSNDFLELLRIDDEVMATVDESIRKVVIKKIYQRKGKVKEAYVFDLFDENFIVIRLTDITKPLKLKGA